MSTAFAALCLFLFQTCSQTAFAAEQQPATARVVYVDNENWKSDIVAANASAGATMRVTNCNVGWPGDTVTFAALGATLIKDFAKSQCNATAPFGIVELTHTGSIDIATEASYRDAKGNVNFVSIPALTDAQKLPASNLNARLTIARAENSPGERSTFLAFFGTGFFTLRVYNGANLKLGEETMSANGATWYELKTPVDIGRVEISRGFYGISFPGSDGGTDTYVIGFVGRRDAGGPRVELSTASVAP